MIETCARVAGTPVELVTAGRAWLTERGVDPGGALPLLDPPEEAADYHRDPAPSLAAGLRLRPLEETVRDTLAWDRERGTPPMTSLSREREAELVAELSG